MFPGPFHLEPVVARLGGVVLAENGPVLLILTLHLHPERTCEHEPCQ